MENLYFYMNKCKSTIMQIISKIGVKSAIIVMEISLSIIDPPY